MATLPDTPSGVIAAKLQFGGVDILPRFQIAYTGGPPNSADLAAIATTISGAYATHLAAYLTSGLSMTLVECFDLANNSTPGGQDATPVVGTRSGTALPLNVCATINFGVNRKYRGAKPKIFTPFGVQADTSGDRIWGATFITDLTAAWLAFIAELSGTSTGGVVLGAQVCVSYYQGKTANPNPNSRYRFIPTPRVTPLVQALTSTEVGQIFGSQRRRLRAL